MSPGQMLVWLAVVSALLSLLGATRSTGQDRNRNRSQVHDQHRDEDHNSSPRTGVGLLAVSAIALSGAMALLMRAFAVEDWTLVYVADNTRSGLGPLIRIAGAWAGAEGSLLLWTTMLAWVALLATRGSGARQVWAVRIGAAVVAGYGLLVAVVASPFDTLAVPAIDGLGLQPVLEYPAMVWHPPILYAGLVGLMLPTIVAASSALARQQMRFAQSLLLVPMALLTIGLVTGAVWANVELGWGGYWAWDPIESAGLVAWLCGAAAIHSRSGRGSTVGSDPVLAATLVAPGIAAIWATTLTRIGVVASVHAFADRPTLRIGLLAVAGLASVLLLSGVLVAMVGVDGRPNAAPDKVLGSQPEQHRRAAVMVLVVAAVFVAVGTYEPMIESATSGDAVAIAGHYYTRLLWPTVVLGAAFAVRADRRWWPALLGAVVGMVSTPTAAGLYALILAAAGGAVAASALSLLRARRPGALAHVGVGLVLVGVAGTVAITSTVVEVATGATATVHGMTISHQGIELIDGNNTTEARATVEIDGAILRPGLVAYELRGVSTAELATDATGFDEIQVLLLDGDADGARYRINRLPRVRLVWLGALLLALGLLAQPLRRLRARSSDNVEASSSPSLPSVAVGDGVVGDGVVVGDDVAVGDGEGSDG